MKAAQRAIDILKGNANEETSKPMQKPFLLKELRRIAVLGTAFFIGLASTNAVYKAYDHPLNFAGGIEIPYRREAFKKFDQSWASVLLASKTMAVGESMNMVNPSTSARIVQSLREQATAAESLIAQGVDIEDISEYIKLNRDVADELAPLAGKALNHDQSRDFLQIYSEGLEDINISRYILLQKLAIYDRKTNIENFETGIGLFQMSAVMWTRSVLNDAENGTTDEFKYALDQQKILSQGIKSSLPKDKKSLVQDYCNQIDLLEELLDKADTVDTMKPFWERMSHVLEAQVRLAFALGIDLSAGIKEGKEDRDIHTSPNKGASNG